MIPSFKILNNTLEKKENIINLIFSITFNHRFGLFIQM